MNYRYYGQFAANDSIEPLDERIAASNAIELDDYYPTAIEAFQWQGEQLCMPQNVSSLAVYYNRDLFEQYGVAEPTRRVDVGRHAHHGDRDDPRRQRQRGAGHRDRGRSVAGRGVRPRRRADHDPVGPVRLVQRRRDRRRPRPADAVHAGHAGGTRGLEELRRPARGVRRDPDRRGGRGRGRRDPVPQRSAGDAHVLASSHHDVPGIGTVRLGRRAAADVRAAGRDLALRRVLHDPRRRTTRMRRGASSSTP